MVDPFDDPEGWLKLWQEGAAEGVKKAIAENDRLGIPSVGTIDGKIVYCLRGKIVPPPDQTPDE